jgi:hypothetical protein
VRREGLTPPPEAAPDDLPTPRSYLKGHFRLIVWCKACRRQRDLDLQTLVHQGHGVDGWLKPPKSGDIGA